MCAPLFSKLVSLAELLLPVVSCEETVDIYSVVREMGERGGERERGEPHTHRSASGMQKKASSSTSSMKPSRR